MKVLKPNAWSLLTAKNSTSTKIINDKKSTRASRFIPPQSNDTSESFCRTSICITLFSSPTHILSQPELHFPYFLKHIFFTARIYPVTPSPTAIMPGSSSSSTSLRPPPDAPTGPRALRYPSRMTSQSRLRPGQTPWNRAPSPSFPRQTSSPLVHSPLQQSFPVDTDASKSAPNSPGHMAAQETPSRRSRLSEQGARPRGESRSSSVPIIIRSSQDHESEVENAGLRPFRSRTRPDSRATSPLPSPGDNQVGQDRRSVKHLTCFWWREKGECKYSEEACRKLPLSHPVSVQPRVIHVPLARSGYTLIALAVYAHHDTGHYTAAPRQVVPGEPAKAGKSLERALNKLVLTNRSSASLASLGNGSANTSERNSLNVSRPESPVITRSRPNTPSPCGSVDMGFQTQLRADNEVPSEHPSRDST